MSIKFFLHKKKKKERKKERKEKHSEMFSTFTDMTSPTPN